MIDCPPEELNSLLGEIFVIGEVVLQGTDLCIPCARPALLDGRPQDGKAFIETFTKRGGLRARILQGGVIYSF